MSRSSPSFEEDMRLIREKRNVSRETLHQQTKVALENIELFEAGDLDRHPHFNEVYLRALVRAYAEVLDISREMALQALDRSRSGTYRGELGDAYLDREAYAEREEETPDAAPKSPPTESEEEVMDPAAEDGEEVDSSVDRPPDDVGEMEDEAAADGIPDGTQDAPSDPDRTDPSRRRPRPARASGAGLKDWLLVGGTGRVVMGVAGVVLLILALWGLAALVPSSSPPESVSDDPQRAVDTADTETADEVTRRTPVAVIGDSLDVTVVAARDKLEPIRVKRDDGPWNPYWVEQGDSISFTAHNEFALRRYLPRARVRIESLEWPVRATSEYDTLIVSRRLVQERIDSLSAARRGTQ